MPALERPHREVARSAPLSHDTMDFPLWTRGDEIEEDGQDVPVKRVTTSAHSKSKAVRDVHQKEKRDSKGSGDESGDDAKGKGPPATQRKSLEKPQLPPLLPGLDTNFGPQVVSALLGGGKDAVRPVDHAADQSSQTRVTPAAPSKTIEASQPPFLGFIETEASAVLSPIVTGLAPAISSGARKGLEGLATGIPNLVSSAIPGPTAITGPAVAAVQGGVAALQSAVPQAEKVGDPNQQNRQTTDPASAVNSGNPAGSPSNGSSGGRPASEKALIAVGSIIGTLAFFLALWLGWKFYKRRKAGTAPRLRPDIPSSQPKQLMVDFASRVPVLRDRVAERTWTNIDKPYDAAYWEKRFSSSNDLPSVSKGITVHTAISTRSDPENQNSTLSSFNQISNQAQPSRTSSQSMARSKRFLSGISDVSSLSSGFGDYDIIMPPATNTATTTTVTAQYLMVPEPAVQRNSVISDASSRRETVYTEVSEDPLPRFRSVNSWVRQQTGRVKRAEQRDAESDAPPMPQMPPEQEFKLMMPDGEVPRRPQDAKGDSPEQARTY